MNAETARVVARLRSLLSRHKQTVRAAAQRVRRSKSTVHRLAKRHGIARRRGHWPRELSAQEERRIQQQLARREKTERAKMTLQAIADLVSCSTKAVWLRAQRRLARRLKRAGAFQPRQLRHAAKCPRGHVTRFAPCVICAAEDAGRQERHKERS